jgi:hypothetical protein
MLNQSQINGWKGYLDFGLEFPAVVISLTAVQKQIADMLFLEHYPTGMV